MKLSHMFQESRSPLNRCDLRQKFSACVEVVITLFWFDDSSLEASPLAKSIYTFMLGEQISSFDRFFSIQN